MKKYLLLLLFGLIGLTAHAQNQIYGLIVITNNPAINETLDVNSDVRTWKSTVTDPSTEITRGASIGASFTNLVLHLRKYPFSNVSALELSGSTNTVRLFGRSGDAMAVTIVTNWASRSYVTNTVRSVANSHRVVDDLAAMQLLDPSLYSAVTIRYHTTLGDGGGGAFYASDESLTDDGGTIIASEAKAGWYWVRDFVGPVYTEWWGANGGDTGDDTAAFNEAAAAFKHIAFLPNRTYNIDGTLTGSGYWLQGPGGALGQTAKIKSFSTNQFALTIGNNSTAVTGIEVSGLSFHGGTTNNFGLKVRGNVDGVTVRDCYFNRFKGIGLHVLGESNPIKNVRIVGTTFLQGTEADDDAIQIDQSSSNNVTGVSFTDCQGTSTDVNSNLILIDSVVVTMSNCRWDVGTAGSKVRLNKTQTTAPIIYGGQSTVTSQAGTAGIKIGYNPSTTSIGTLVPNMLIVGNLEYNDASTTTWSGMAQPQFSSLNFLTASPEGALTSLAGSLASANLGGIPNLYIKGKTASLSANNWVPVIRDRIVENYGAVGDGVTDDTTAIQTAMSAGGRVVFSMDKIYRITDTLDFTVGDTHLFFEPGAEILMDANNIAVICNDPFENISIVGGTFRMNGAKGISNAAVVQMNKAEGFYIKGVTVVVTNALMDAAGIGMNAFNTSQGASGLFEDCVANGTVKSGYHISTGSDFITLRNCIATNNYTTNTATYGHTPGFDTSGSFIKFLNCIAYDPAGPGFLLSADGPVETNSCADNVLIQNCEVWNPGVRNWSAEGWGFATRSAYDEWPTNIVVNGLRVYNAYNSVLKLEKGEDIDISNVQGYNVNYLGVVGDDDTRKVRLSNVFLSGNPDSTNTTRAFFADGGTNYVINAFEIRDFDRGFEHTTGPAMNDVSISGFRYLDVATPFLFNSTHQITNGHWALRGPWATPNASTHGAAPDGSVWFNTTAGAATAFYVKVNGTWTAK